MDVELRIVVPVADCHSPYDKKVLAKLARALPQVIEHLDDGVPEQWITDDDGNVIARHRVETYQEV